MNQSKIESAIETFVNMGSGFIIACLIWKFIVGPLYDAELIGTIEITTIFTVVSVARSYFWRRFFNSRVHSTIQYFYGRFSK